MPLFSIVTIQLKTEPNPNAVLNNPIHGVIHRLFSSEPSTEMSNNSPATVLHDSQRQPLTLRDFKLKGRQLLLEITTLDSNLEDSTKKAFQSSNDFGSDTTRLQGTVTNVEHHSFTLQQLRDIIRQLSPPSRIQIEFKSPTAFTHKRGTWASPHPSLFLKSLHARWQDFSGTALTINDDCIVRAEPHIVTGTTPIGSGTMEAFEGNLHLELAGQSEMRWDLTTLVAFASLVNTGRRVAYGCGLVEATVQVSRDQTLKLNPGLILQGN
jgi:CRISPR/Cas system endoribonuclease Cas6 (RAMP superfamily)